MQLTETSLHAAVDEMDRGDLRHLPVSPILLLRERVASAVKEIPFYQDLYKPFLPIPTKASDTEFLEWFHDLPIPSKSNLQAAGSESLLNRNYNVADLVRKPTSGSTGIPFVLYLDRRLEEFRKWRFQRPHRRAKAEPNQLAFVFPWDFVARTPRQARIDAVARGVSAAARQPHSQPDNPGICSGRIDFRIMPKKSRRIRKERRAGEQAADRDTGAGLDNSALMTDRPFTVNSLLPPDRLFEALIELKPTSLIGFASAIAELARWMDREGKSLQSVRRVWTTSEVLSPEGAEAIRSSLKCEPRVIYASNEFGFMAWESEPGGSLSFETDRLYVEALCVAGRAVADKGELARLVITDLLNDTMPLIRYDIGDLATPLETVAQRRNSSCITIRDLQGKLADQVESVSGRTVTTFEILGTIKDCLPNAQYRFVCLEPSRFVLQYRPGVGFDPAHLVEVTSELAKIFGISSEIVPQEVDRIDREPSGKLRPVINMTRISGVQRIRLAAHLRLVPLIKNDVRHVAAALVQEALADALPGLRDGSALNEAAELYADLAVDSLRFVRIVLELEKRLGEEIQDDDLLDAEIVTAGDLISFVEGKLVVFTKRDR